jgi:hypothetical protein
MPNLADIPLPPLDARLGVHVIFVSVPREEVIFVKVLLESFEGVAAYRTQDAEHVPGRALIAVLAPPDFVADTRRILAEIRESADLVAHAPTPAELEKLNSDLFDSGASD